MRINLEKFLQTNNIPFELYNHMPIFTNEEALQVKKELGFTGSETKSLFLKDKDRVFYIYLTFTTKNTDFKKLAQTLGKKLTFVKAEEMEELTNQKPGAVSPLGYVSEITILIDNEILNTEKLVFAPGRGDQTMVIKTEHLLPILKLLNNPIVYID